MNTQTGRISRDLPTESDEDVSEGHLTRSPASQTSSSVGRSKGIGFGASSPINAGFGLSNHTEIPEPWVRKLADDGMSYYFTNKQTGQISWTIPGSESLSSRTGRSRATTKSSTSSSHIRDTNRLRSDSSVSVSGQGSEHSVDRFSLYSDNSETFLIERDRDGSLPVSQQPLINGHRALDWTRNTSPELMDDDAAVVELTSAEQSAKSLQQALSPPGPESLADLSGAARRAIMAVMKSIQTIDITRFLEDDTTLDDLVHTVVISIRNLLYVSAAPSGHLPSNIAPGVLYPRDRRNTTASQALLKPAQRKVTATLSKLVLSARAIQYNSGSSIIDTPIRIESDAEELERAVAAFVLEVQRSQNQQLHSAAGLKRLHGVFSTAHIGLGLVGAGAAGSWKGLGWISLEETDDDPGRILGTEVVTELRTYVSQIQESFISFRSSVRQLINEPGKSR